MGGKGSVVRQRGMVEDELKARRAKNESGRIGKHGRRGSTQTRTRTT